jgi:hypothetical protein
LQQALQAVAVHNYYSSGDSSDAAEYSEELLGQRQWQGDEESGEEEHVHNEAMQQLQQQDAQEEGEDAVTDDYEHWRQHQDESEGSAALGCAALCSEALAASADQPAVGLQGPAAASDVDVELLQPMQLPWVVPEQAAQQRNSEAALLEPMQLPWLAEQTQPQHHVESPKQPLEAPPSEATAAAPAQPGSSGSLLRRLTMRLKKPAAAQQQQPPESAMQVIGGECAASPALAASPVSAASPAVCATFGVAAGGALKAATSEGMAADLGVTDTAANVPAATRVAAASEPEIVPADDPAAAVVGTEAAVDRAADAAAVALESAAAPAAALAAGAAAGAAATIPAASPPVSPLRAKLLKQGGAFARFFHFSKGGRKGAEANVVQCEAEQHYSDDAAQAAPTQEPLLQPVQGLQRPASSLVDVPPGGAVFSMGACAAVCAASEGSPDSGDEAASEQQQEQQQQQQQHGGDCSEEPRLEEGQELAAPRSLPPRQDSAVAPVEHPGDRYSCAGGVAPLNAVASAEVDTPASPGLAANAVGAPSSPGSAVVALDTSAPAGGIKGRKDAPKGAFAAAAAAAGAAARFKRLGETLKLKAGTMEQQLAPAPPLAAPRPLGALPAGPALSAAALLLEQLVLELQADRKWRLVQQVAGRSQADAVAPGLRDAREALKAVQLLQLVGGGRMAAAVARACDVSPLWVFPVSQDHGEAAAAAAAAAAAPSLPEALCAAGTAQLAASRLPCETPLAALHVLRDASNGVAARNRTLLALVGHQAQRMVRGYLDATGELCYSHHKKLAARQLLSSELLRVARQEGPLVRVEPLAFDSLLRGLALGMPGTPPGTSGCSDTGGLTARSCGGQSTLCGGQTARSHRQRRQRWSVDVTAALTTGFADLLAADAARLVASFWWAGPAGRGVMVLARARRTVMGPKAAWGPEMSAICSAIALRQRSHACLAAYRSPTHKHHPSLQTRFCSADGPTALVELSLQQRVLRRTHELLLEYVTLPPWQEIWARANCPPAGAVAAEGRPCGSAVGDVALSGVSAMLAEAVFDSQAQVLLAPWAAAAPGGDAAAGGAVCDVVEDRVRGLLAPYRGFFGRQHLAALLEVEGDWAMQALLEAALERFEDVQVGNLKR